MVVIAIDFDGVINDKGKLIPGAVDAIDNIILEGIEVIIFTAKAQTEKGREWVAEWLDEHDIDYAEVTAVKPVADMYIDDKGYQFKDWKSTIKEVNKRLGVEI